MPIATAASDQTMEPGLRRRFLYLADSLLALCRENTAVPDAVATLHEFTRETDPEKRRLLLIRAEEQLRLPLEYHDLKRELAAFARTVRFCYPSQGGDIAMEIPAGATPDAAAIRKYSRELEKWKRWIAAQPHAWYPGFFYQSSGRFACMTAGNADLISTNTATSLERPYFLYEGGDTCGFSFTPAEAKLQPLPDNERVNWCSSLLAYQGATRSGTWTFTQSLLAPLVLVNTSFSGVDFRFFLQRGKSPGEITVPLGDGRYGTARTAELSKLNSLLLKRKSSWLLFSRRDGMAETPVLLIVSGNLRADLWNNDVLRLSRRDGGEFGRFGVGFATGVTPLRAGEALPDSQLAARAALFEKFTRAYPVVCRDFFRRDSATRQVRIRQQIAYDLAPDATPEDRLSVIPPLLGMASAMKVPRIELPSDVIDSSIMTKYGMLYYSPGDTCEYALPLPELAGYLALPSQQIRAAADESCGPEIDSFLKNGWMHSKELARALIHLPGFFSVAAYLSPENRAKLETDFQDSFRELRQDRNRMNQVRKSRFSPRRDPRTGMGFLSYGWLRTYGQVELSGDVPNFSGYLLYGMLSYLRASGDWNRIEAEWPLIEELFTAVCRRQDWAVPGPSCMEWGFEHNLDMGADSFKAPVAMSVFARLRNDRYLEELAGYLSAGQSLALGTALNAAKLNLKFSNCGNAQSLLETGWDARGGVNPWHSWKSPRQAGYILSGTVPIPETYEMFLELVPGYLSEYIFHTVERHLPYPQWIDPTFVPPEQSKWYSHGRHNISQFIYARCLLGEPQPELKKKLDTYLDGGKALQPMAQMAFLTLDSPVEIANWEPGKLEYVCYDRQKREGRIVIDATQSASDIQLKLKTGLLVVRGMLDGNDIALTGLYGHGIHILTLPAGKRSELLLELASGDYAGSPVRPIAGGNIDRMRRNLDELAKSGFDGKSIRPASASAITPLWPAPGAAVTVESIMGVEMKVPNRLRDNKEKIPSPPPASLTVNAGFSRIFLLISSEPEAGESVRLNYADGRTETVSLKTLPGFLTTLNQGGGARVMMIELANPLREQQDFVSESQLGPAEIKSLHFLLNRETLLYAAAGTFE